MEVCVDSIESAINAYKGGATRLELCSNLVSGGTTPTIGLMKLIKKSIHDIPVFVMVRPRSGDFCYSDEEFAVMKEDLLSLKQEKADGFVFGILTPDGAVDKDRCSELLTLAQPLPATFHRAFDMTRDPFVQLETIILLGFQRILTSGLANTALDSVTMIRQLIKRSQERIIIMPGAGISASNIQTIIDQSGAREFHGSASRTCQSVMKYRNETISMGTGTSNEYTLKVTDQQAVSELAEIIGKNNKLPHVHPL